MIKDLVTLNKKSVNDLALTFISSAQDNLEYLKNPLSMFEHQNLTAGPKKDRAILALGDSQIAIQ